VLGAEFRAADFSDCRWLWQVRSHPSVAEQSLNSAPIGYLKHCRWYKQLLQDNHRQLLIFSDCQNGARLGYIRAERYETGQLLSWVIAPELHGQGLGKRMLSTWCQSARNCLWAQIKSSNLASQAIAASVGFSRIKSDKGVELWSRQRSAAI
jgi:RimJ/RimL family protein N-acetyltransferase